MKVAFLGLAIAGAQPSAEPSIVTANCEMTAVGDSEGSRGYEGTYQEFSGTGQYRVDFSNRSVTKSFRVNFDDENFDEDLIYIDKFIQFDRNQIVFCEDSKGCGERDSSTSKAEANVNTRPTVLDLKNGKVSYSTHTYAGSFDGTVWMNLDSKYSGTCVTSQ